MTISNIKEYGEGETTYNNNGAILDKKYEFNLIKSCLKLK